MSDLLETGNAAPKKRRAAKPKEKAAPEIPMPNRIAQLSGILSGFRVEMGHILRRIDKAKEYSDLLTKNDIVLLDDIGRDAFGIGAVGDALQKSFDSRTSKA